MAGTKIGNRLTTKNHAGQRPGNSTPQTAGPQTMQPAPIVTSPLDPYIPPDELAPEPRSWSTIITVAIVIVLLVASVVYAFYPRSAASPKQSQPTAVSSVAPVSAPEQKPKQPSGPPPGMQVYKGYVGDDAGKDKFVDWLHDYKLHKTVYLDITLSDQQVKILEKDKGNLNLYTGINGDSAADEIKINGNLALIHEPGSNRIVGKIKLTKVAMYQGSHFQAQIVEQ